MFGMLIKKKKVKLTTIVGCIEKMKDKLLLKL